MKFYMINSLKITSRPVCLHPKGLCAFFPKTVYPNDTNFVIRYSYFAKKRTHATNRREYTAGNFDKWV